MMRRLWTLVGTLAIVVTACGNGDTATARSTPNLTVVQPVIGEALAEENAALYFTIESRGGDDELVDVVAGALRTSVMDASTPMHQSSSKTGFPLDLPAGSTTRFVPGQSHVMLEDLDADFTPGTTISITFTFRRNDPITISAPVVATVDLVELIDPDAAP